MTISKEECIKRGVTINDVNRAIEYHNLRIYNGESVNTERVMAVAVAMGVQCHISQNGMIVVD